MSNPVEVHLPMFAHSSPEATLAFTRALPRYARGKIPREALLALAAQLQAARTAR
jgi:acyl-coenzyme A synthetase/AMP-(fatty) acid ligase